MKFYAASLLALLPAMATAQRPSNTSVCDYYSMALFNSTNGTSQYGLLTALVNTAVIGNWTNNTANVKVTGILNNGTYNGTMISLLPYFSGMLKSSNRSGVATAINFLDDGGAAPLKMGMPANGTSSNQYRLLTHLYEFFGALLGCTSYSSTGFPAYSGNTNMYAVHGFMALNQLQNGYFIQQVGLAAASFGVAAADIQYVGNALDSLFNKRCSAPAAILPMAPVEPQAICIASSCPLAMNNTCSAYAQVMPVMTANGTNYTSPSMSNATSSANGSMSGSGGSSTSTAKSWAATAGPALGSVALGAIAVLVL